MEPIIVRTKASEETDYALYKEQTRTVFIIFLALYAAFAAVFAALTVYSALNEPELNVVWPVGAAIFLALIVFWISRGNKARKAVREKLEKLGETEDIYVFEADRFTNDFSGKGFSEHVERDYEAVTKVAERYGCLFIYTRDKTVFTLNKADIPEGELARIRALLTSKNTK
jgi:hypothetical protein